MNAVLSCRDVAPLSEDESRCVLQMMTPATAMATATMMAAEALTDFMGPPSEYVGSQFQGPCRRARRHPAVMGNQLLVVLVRATRKLVLLGDP